MILFKNLIQLVALTLLFFTCSKKDNSNIKSDLINYRGDSIKETKNVIDKSVIQDSTVWNQYKIIREVDVEDTLPYKSCKIVMWDNKKLFKYYVNGLVKLQDSLTIVKEIEGYKKYKLIKYDTCLSINEDIERLTFQSCNLSATFVTEYFKMEK